MVPASRHQHHDEIPGFRFRVRRGEIWGLGFIRLKLNEDIKFRRVRVRVSVLQVSLNSNAGVKARV